VVFHTLAANETNLMRKVLLFSLLLVAGLVVSQFLGGRGATLITWLTLIGLSFIMIHVGYEFDMDKSRPRQYVWDYLVAGTAAAFPWIFCAAYFVYVLAPRELWGFADQWKESLLLGRFASPTSAGVLFSMLAAAGLAATWVFKKARILAIFDDLDTILLMIPLKIMMVGFKWQLSVLVVAIVALLWAAWRWLHVVRLPHSWPWVLGYSVGITAVCEGIYHASKVLDDSVPVHLEVLLPAFVLGCIMARPAGHDPHRDDAREGHQEGQESANEQRVATIISACFMVLVGLSMPAIRGESVAPMPEDVVPVQTVEETSALTFAGASPAALAAKAVFPGWGAIALHVLAITVISNIGKMFPLFCYRREAHWKERLALSIGMFPRGEVGAGVLVISLSYGLGGTALTVAVLSLGVNLLLTGVFILWVKGLIGSVERTGEGSFSKART
jgi:Kef-type K+ transport system membrane component KefB